MGEAWSGTIEATAPALAGVWMHAPADPDASERNFLYKKGERSNPLGVEVAEVRLNGREFPILEFGEGASESVSTTVIIPHDEEHDAGVQWWIDELHRRRIVCYRDNRGRVVFGSFAPGISRTDIPEGTSIAFTLTRLDYTEAI